MTSAPIESVYKTEEAVINILNEWLKTYFTGQTVDTIAGPINCPDAVLYFGDADLSKLAEDKPQIHTVITEWMRREMWFAQGKLSLYEFQIQHPSAPAKVIYGAAADGKIEESVNGKLSRRLNGYNIRWETSGGALREQLQAADGSWTDNRSWTGADSIRWTVSGKNFTEEVKISGTWTQQRMISAENALWDGTKKLITGPMTLTMWVRVHLKANQSRARTLLRDTSAALVALLRLGKSRDELTKRGMTNLNVIRGPIEQPSALPVATSFITVRFEARAFIPFVH